MSRIARWTLMLVVALLTLTASLGSAFAEPPYPPPATPSATPIRTPEATRISTPVATPIRTPEATRISTPYPTRTSTPVRTPEATRIATPIRTPEATRISTPYPTPIATPVRPPVDNSALERAYQMAQQQLREQEAQLIQARTYAGAVQEMIIRLKANHQETAPLERALVAYRARLAAAQHEWELARDILRAHLGFDAQGKVTNPDQARATVAAARGHMENVAYAIRMAYSELSAALAAYRLAHPHSIAPERPSVY